MLPLRSSLQLPNCPTILIENPILPFDKSRPVARKSRLPLISSSRTSLSSVLLHNLNRAAAGKCFSWPIRTDLLHILLLSSSSSSHIAYCVSKGRSRYLQSSVLELDLISQLQWILPKWIASWFLMRIMESLINTTMKKLPQMVVLK